MNDFFSKLRKTIKGIEKIADDLEEDMKETVHEDKSNDYDGDISPQHTRIDLIERLSLEELTRITGLPFDSYNDYLDDDWVGGVYTISDPDYYTYFQVWFARKDVDGYNPLGVLEYYKEVLPDLLFLDKLGDEAFWSDSGTLFVRNGSEVVQASTNNDSKLTLDILKKLARKLLK